jgi:hypothetical protein
MTSGHYDYNDNNGYNDNDYNDALNEIFDHDYHSNEV